MCLFTMGMVVILFNAEEMFARIVNIPLIEGPMGHLVNWSSDFREKDIYKLHDFIMYIIQGQAQIPPMRQNFDCN